MSEAATTTLPQNECDLVMKGGITSGVVYPGAIRKIAGKYRFRNLGGASAGAIAAVAAAACEYRRNAHQDPKAYDVLGDVSKEIGQQGFVLGLFQPTAKARPAFEVGLRLATTSGSLRDRLPPAIVAILGARRPFQLAALLAVVAWALLVAGALFAGGTSVFEIVLLALVFLVGAALLVAGVALVALLNFAEELHDSLKENFLGMCTGMTEEGAAGPALTPWLYQTIQSCAGPELDHPLSFADLRGPDPDDPLVNLQMITTDLSSSRPVTIPLPEPEPDEPPPYFFDREELKRLFPEDVVEHMVDHSPETVEGTTIDGKQRTFHRVPGVDLPIVVAARLSLSFPMLLSTVPLWKQDGPKNGGVERKFVPHTMSDGGICSNFPIHFFDSLFPGRPTFGLDLQPWRTTTQKFVEMSDQPRRAGFSNVSDVGTFFTQLLNAARNWRDNMQAELPGYRDRICQIRLTESEGGLNLNMEAKTVQDLVKRGEQAGDMVTDPTAFNWNKHRVTRFRILMQMLQQSLGPVGFGRPGVYREPHPGREPFRTVIEEWQAGKGEPSIPPPVEWWTNALLASDSVYGLVGAWADKVDFGEAPDLRPTPVMRILPRS